MKKWLFAIVFAAVAMALNRLWLYLGFRGDARENTLAVVLFGMALFGAVLAPLLKLGLVRPGPWGETWISVGIMTVGSLVWALDVFYRGAGVASVVGLVTMIVGIVLEQKAKKLRRKSTQ